MAIPDPVSQRIATMSDLLSSTESHHTRVRNLHCGRDAQQRRTTGTPRTIYRHPLAGIELQRDISQRDTLVRPTAVALADTIKFEDHSYCSFRSRSAARASNSRRAYLINGSFPSPAKRLSSAARRVASLDTTSILESSGEAIDALDASSTYACSKSARIRNPTSGSRAKTASWRKNTHPGRRSSRTCANSRSRKPRTPSAVAR